MNRTSHSLPGIDNAEMQMRVERVITLLAESLSMLDALGMVNEATHVSFGYELSRERLETLRNEANSGGLTGTTC